MKEIIFIIVGAVLVNNFVLNRFLGICPFLGVSKRISSSLGMGMAVTFVLTFSSIITWTVYTYLLFPLGLVYLEYVAFILVIAFFVQLVEMILRKMHPALYEALGIYLPLITTNCAILGLALLNIIKGYGFLEALFFGLSAGIGFTLALLIMSGIRERLSLAPIPQSLKDAPIALITAGILSLAFMGFSGLVPM